MLRMDGEERGDESAGPKLAGQSPKEHKQGDRRGGVEQHVGEMMPPGLQSEELAIEHVREWRKRIPFAEWPLGECPADAFGGQARPDRWVIIDKPVVVVIEQLVTERLTVDKPDGDEQGGADTPRVVGVGWRLLVVSGWWHRSFTGSVMWPRSLESTANSTEACAP
jgi:hypothetical protein